MEIARAVGTEGHSPPPHSAPLQILTEYLHQGTEWGGEIMPNVTTNQSPSNFQT